MAADLARTPSSGIYVQCCGDAHVSNFGMFATPERTMAFDVNDFDESHPAPFEWDVMRLVASIVVAGDDNGFSRKSSRAIAQHAATRYREQVRTLSKMNSPTPSSKAGALAADSRRRTLWSPCSPGPTRIHPLGV